MVSQVSQRRPSLRYRMEEAWRDASRHCRVGLARRLPWETVDEDGAAVSQASLRIPAIVRRMNAIRVSRIRKPSPPYGGYTYATPALESAEEPAQITRAAPPSQLIAPNSFAIFRTRAFRIP